MVTPLSSTGTEVLPHVRTPSFPPPQEDHAWKPSVFWKPPHTHTHTQSTWYLFQEVAMRHPGHTLTPSTHTPTLGPSSPSAGPILNDPSNLGCLLSLQLGHWDCWTFPRPHFFLLGVLDPLLLSSSLSSCLCLLGKVVLTRYSEAPGRGSRLHLRTWERLPI